MPIMGFIMRYQQSMRWMEMLIRDIRMHWLILIKIMSKQRFSRESLEKELLNQKKYGMSVTMMIFI